MKSFMKLAGIILVLFVSFSLAPLVTEGSSPPPMPSIYSGSITVGGEVPSDSVTRIIGVRNECVTNCVTVKMGDFVSDGGVVIGGNYSVTVGPPNSSYVSSEVIFYYNDMVVAAEADRFIISASFRMIPNFDLTFPDLPTPTPVPSATPTVTPIATPSPVPTATAEATATPANLPSMVFSGTISYIGGEGDVFKDKQLLGRVGSHMSNPLSVMPISGPGKLGIFDGLVLNPLNRKFLGKEIHFDFGGIAAIPGSSIYFLEAGGELEIELEVWDDRPTEVPPSPTEIPPTATKVPPTVISVAPTATAVPPVPTGIPTASIPTPVPAAPVPTVTASVATVVIAASPTVESQPEGEGDGGCNNPSPVSKLTGAANALMLFGPLLLVGGYRGWKRRKRE